MEPISITAAAVGLLHSIGLTIGITVGIKVLALKVLSVSATVFFSLEVYRQA
jgi:hypothetical protein